MYKFQRFVQRPPKKMEKVTFHIQSSKTEGKIKVRYRLTDGRVVQFSHKTDIKCEPKELEKLNPDGTPKGRIQIYNQELSRKLKEEYELMLKAYALMRDNGLDMTSAVFEREITRLRNPIEVIREENPNIVTRFRQYADRALRDGVLGPNRNKHIIVVSDKLERFLIIKGISGITAEEFTDEHLLDFRDFLFNEYLYVDKSPKLYDKVKKQNKPSARLSMNTVSSQMKMFQTFFTELEDRDEIRKSPFRKLGKEKKKSVMRTKYDDPIFLRKEEFQRILNNPAPKRLEDTRDAFLVQCAFGCRISDFMSMSMDKVAVSDEGIPYVHYLPKKTADSQEGNTEVKTPIVRFAFDIIKRTGFVFPALKNVSGTMGYNTRIKGLLQFYKIDRFVPQYNEGTRENDYIELYKVGSSKLARKTHVDLMNKVQVDMYAAGLHKEGSSAVKRYTNMEIKDRFALMNAAFEQESYIVDNNLSIIE